jgi:AsmA-like C-terminal region
VIAVGVGAVLLTLAALGSRSPVLRKKLVETLEAKLDADVELQNLHASAFPTLNITGDGLKVRMKGQSEGAPIIEASHFEVSAGFSGLFHRPRRFQFVRVDGLRITIPPETDHDDENDKASSQANPGPVIIERLEAIDAELVIVPDKPDKQPKVFTIHELHMESVGFDRSMPFEATLTNPIPKGHIQTRGSFGPWHAADPGKTPLSGRYQFTEADLGTIKGIGGILSSVGDFAGQLERIDVRGTTKTPDFSVDISGQPVPLDTTFHAIVDGTNGDTYLEPVDAQFLSTKLTAKGGVYGTKDVKGRTIDLDVVMQQGKLEDVLKLAVKSAKPVMTGAITLTTKLLIPAGEARVADKMRLDGQFSISHAHFTDRGVQEKLATLSRRSRGKKKDEPGPSPGQIQSDMKGRFIMRDGVVRFDPLVFDVPGAVVTVAGTYKLRGGELDFAGTFAMAATISNAVESGWARILLKPFDPLFKRKNAGAVLPIKITGTREDPQFGVDIGKALRRK